MSATTDWRHETRDELAAIIDALLAATPEIKSVLAQQSGETGRTNASGDRQLVIDDRIDQLLFEALSPLDGVGEFASEEREELVDVGSGLSVATDPLDGSSNVEANTTVGTIIGVYDAPLPARGRDLVASICLVFGPITTLAVATDGELVEHTVQDGHIVDSEPLTLPEEDGIWGFSGRPDRWSPALSEYRQDLSEEHKHRYTGAMIADVWLLLAHGGLVGYPATDASPDGVLRLQYESNPIAYAIEAAGGAASTGSQRILDVEPEGLHQRVPTYFGSRARIEELENRLSAER